MIHPVPKPPPREKRPTKPLPRSTAPIKKVNAKAAEKRRSSYRKHLASPEYKRARREAMERSGGECEHSFVHAPSGMIIRCPETEYLHAHHRAYPKSRPLDQHDLQILCPYHHAMIEARDHPTRRHGK